MTNGDDKHKSDQPEPELTEEQKAERKRLEQQERERRNQDDAQREAGQGQRSSPPEKPANENDPASQDKDDAG